MLSAGAAERVHHVLGDVVAALHGDGLDGVRHVDDGDSDEAVGDLFRRPPVAELPRQRLERFGDGRPVERLILTGPEDMREEIGLELAGHDVGVGDRERAAAPVGEGARDRRRPSRVRPGTAPRRNEGSSRRPPPPYGSASSAHARARPPPRSRRSAHTRRHSGRRRWRCRPCRSRSPCRSPRCAPFPPRPPRRPPAPTGSRPCRGTDSPRSARPRTA